MSLLSLLGLPTRTDVLAEYARTMAAVQYFEDTVLLVNHLLRVAEETQQDTTLSDDEFMAVFDEGKRHGLTRRLKMWNDTAQRLGLQPSFPDKAFDLLFSL